MRRFQPSHLPPEVATKLDVWQSEINKIPKYPDRVHLALTAFKRRNVKNNVTFAEVRKLLREAAGESNRCTYCEDSEANQVEHVLPKSFFPEHAFRWQNYVWACGLCNGSKNSRFAVFNASGELVELKRGAADDIVEPPAGMPVPIDPQAEDPAEYLYLDLQTGVLAPQLNLSPRDNRRAEYTIELYQLETRPAVRKARMHAVRNFLQRLKYYVSEREKGTPASLLLNVSKEVRGLPHQTVWEELKRSRHSHVKVEELFRKAPESLNW